MFDTLIDIGCAFDWITPTWAFIQDWTNGPHASFGISAYIGYDRGDIRRMLQTHGIKVWGLMYNLSGEMMMFTVSKTQARWAYYILQREGVPVMYAPREAIEPIPQAAPVASDDTSIFHFLDKLWQ